jgi:hypothetical protein
VLGATTVRLPEHHIMQAGLQHRRLQVVRDDPSGHTAERVERPPMAGDPGADLLVEHHLGVLVAAVSQRHHEDPGPSGLPGPWVQQRPGAAEVDLRLLARPRVDAHHRTRRVRAQLAHEAADR